MKRNRLTITLIILVVLLLSAGGVAWWWLRPSEPLDVNDYSLDQLVDRSIEAIDPEKKATILSGKAVDKDVLVLNFVDLSIASINDEILSLLDTYNVKATFFVSGINAIEEQTFLSQVHEQKHQIGSLGLDGSEQLDKLATSEVMSQLVRGRALIQQNILNNAYRPLLYAKSTQYNDSFLVRAYAAGHNEVVSHDVILNYRSFASYDEVKTYINKLPAGTSIAIKLQGELSSDEYVEDDTPAIDKPPSVDETLTKEERILQLVTWVVMAINERDASVISNQDLQDLPEKEEVIVVPDVETPVLPGKPVQPSISEAQRLRIANQGKLATVSSMIYTTQKAVNYSFYGVREVDVLQQVLLALQQANIKATFFVSSDDLTRYDGQIKQIVAAGHELQMIIKESDGTTYESVANDLLWMKATIQSRYGQQAKYVRYAYDRVVETEVLEAISATGCAFVQHTLAIARSNIDPSANASIIYDELSNTGTTALKRGELVYFRMDYYKDPTVIAQLVTSIKVGKVDPIAYFGQGGYSFTTMKDLNESTMRYQLLDGSVALPVAFGKADTSVQQIQQRYIGNPDINAGNVLPGFSEEELLGLDTVGKLKLQAQPTMYLTFDDWGSDAAINKLLFVLDKYQVKATFFVRTNYVQTNPNLLRAIAEAGHTIASHTDNHLVLSNYVTGSIPSQYLDLTADEAKALQSDVVTSYRKLYEIVGDTNALSTIFRPPTLAVGKTGMKAVLDVGYTYLISGDYSTKDYEATSAQVFIDGFHTAYQNQQVGDGSVVVMHMSDTAEYTAEGLDTILPSYLAQGYSFKRVVEGVN